MLTIKTNKILRKSAIVIIALFLSFKSSAQAGSADTVQVLAFVVDGDTIPGGRMLDVLVRSRMPERWRKYWAEWTRLRNAVYVTYPYAKAAGRIMNDINIKLCGITDKK